jgi:hypothetical protein
MIATVELQRFRCPEDHCFRAFGAFSAGYQCLTANHPNDPPRTPKMVPSRIGGPFAGHLSVIAPPFLRPKMFRLIAPSRSIGNPLPPVQGRTGQLAVEFGRGREVLRQGPAYRTCLPEVEVQVDVEVGRRGLWDRLPTAL